MRKLRKLEQDIFDVLKKKESSMLLWREVVNPLWPIYQNRYKKGGKKSFGVVVSRTLKRLEDLGLIKQEGDYWGTLGSSPPAYGEPTSLWDRLRRNLEQVGGHLIEMQLQKASDGGFDPVTGWPHFTHDGTEYSIRGIMVLRSAKELVGVAQSFKIYVEHPFAGAGVLLTQGPIEFMDRLWWKGELYQIKDLEERDDGYNFSFRIGYLEWIPK